MARQGQDSTTASHRVSGFWRGVIRIAELVCVVTSVRKYVHTYVGRRIACGGRIGQHQSRTAKSKDDMQA